MYLHLRLSILVTCIAAILVGCKALPPRLDSMTDRFVCFHAKNTKEYRDWYKDEVTSRGLDCNALAVEPVRISSKPKKEVVSEVKSNPKISDIPSKSSIFGNASDSDICEKYTGFVNGNRVVKINELVGFALYVDAAGLSCAVADFSKVYQEAEIPGSQANEFDHYLCERMTKFAEGKIYMGIKRLASIEMELNRRRPTCWISTTMASEPRNLDKNNTPQSPTRNIKPAKTELFERVSDAAICLKYDSLFEANNNMSTAERNALRYQMEKRKLNCSASTAKVAPIKQDIRKNTVSQAADVERQILARYGKADEVERYGSAAVFKYCKTGLMGDSYTYVWSDGQSVKQIYKGKWTAPFLCAGAHRSVDWVRTMESSALVLIQPNRRPRKSFGEAMAEGMEQSMQSNQGIYNSLIKGGGDTVTCNKLGDMRFPKQVYTFQGSFCPMGYIQAF